MPRSEPSYLIGMDFLVISGAVAPLTDVKAPGAEPTAALPLPASRASTIGRVLLPSG
jgi:hypothetical protein